MNDSAPNLSALGAQRLVVKNSAARSVKIGHASLVVDHAMRMRMARTDRPQASTMIRNALSLNLRPPRRFSDSVVALGSEMTAVTGGSRGELVQLRHGLLLDVVRQRGVVEVREQLLAVTQQVAEVGLLQGQLGCGLLLVHDHPALVGDRVGVGIRRV